MKKSTILLLLISGTIYYSCKSTKTISNPLWNGDCPFAGLEFTYVEEVDSFSRALNFNDSLTVGLKADLEKLKGEGKIGNNLNVTIDKFKSESRTRKVEIDDEEYVKWLQDKTKTLCGLHGQLKDGGM